VHDRMVSGVAATDLMSLMFSATTARPASGDWSAKPERSSLEILIRALVRLAGPGDQLEAMRRALVAPVARLRTAAEVLSAAAAAGPSMRPVAASSLTGPIGPHRRWSWADASLSDVKRVRAAFGGTVHDVV